MSDCILWRIEPLAPPPLERWCPRCGRQTCYQSSQRFRVNAQQGRLDVWLLYRCSGCDLTAKQRVLRRRPVAELEPGELAGYLCDDSELAWRRAFDVPLTASLPYRVVRPPVPGSGRLRVRVIQPYPCALRWDRLLAGELGWSRSRVRRAMRSGHLSIPGTRSLAAPVRHGQEFLLEC